MKHRIELNGPEGNAWFLMARAQQWGQDLDLDHKAITADMRSGDYNHLLKVFLEHFEEYVYFTKDDVEYIPE